MKRRRSDKQIRKRKAMQKRLIETHLAELERAKVPPGIIAQVAPLMALLIGARR